jgi:acetylornithine deacetylase/succinyl-diaminopimelate desuccinylase-like protein
MRNLQVNGERLWASLMELARIGATPKGGVCRLAASDLDGEARCLFIRWCEEAGCTVRIDKIGIFARRSGRGPGARLSASRYHQRRRPRRRLYGPRCTVGDDLCAVHRRRQP